MLIATCKLFLTVVCNQCAWVCTYRGGLHSWAKLLILAVVTLVWFFTSVGADVLLERLAKGKLPLTVVRSPGWS